MDLDQDQLNIVICEIIIEMMDHHDDCRCHCVTRLVCQQNISIIKQSYILSTQHLGNHWTWQYNLLCRQLAQKLNVHEPVKLFWSFGFQWLTRPKFLKETRDQCKLIKPDFLSQSRAGWVYVVECLASQIWVSVSAPLNRQILSISPGSYFSVHYLYCNMKWQPLNIFWTFLLLEPFTWWLIVWRKLML